MEVGARNSYTSDAIELSISTDPSPEPPLSALVSTNASIDVSVLIATKATDDKRGTYNKAPHIDTK